MKDCFFNNFSYILSNIKFPGLSRHLVDNSSMNVVNFMQTLVSPYDDSFFNEFIDGRYDYNFGHEDNYTVSTGLESSSMVSGCRIYYVPLIGDDELFYNSFTYGTGLYLTFKLHFSSETNKVRSVFYFGFVNSLFSSSVSCSSPDLSSTRVECKWSDSADFFSYDRARLTGSYLTSHFVDFFSVNLSGCRHCVVDSDDNVSSVVDSGRSVLNDFNGDSYWYILIKKNYVYYCIENSDHSNCFYNCVDISSLSVDSIFRLFFYVVYGFNDIGTFNATFSADIVFLRLSESVNKRVLVEFIKRFGRK